ncbi:uncharacterized protein [Diadema antillarum]|uniref:uncharacterized protein n=1 Tax=Diadema antillarum TaxID=105358 RepID=UPI003A83B8C3
MGSIGITFLVVTAVIYFGQVRSQLVPEDVVYTNPRAAFWEGQQIVSLPCLFRGEPIAVYWKKGATVDTAEDLIVWYKGQKSGTRFDDGSVDILVSQNYSLVFKQPLDFNMAGNYICRVSNYKAELHANSTTVTVREFQMQTTPRLTVLKGETASLPCKLPYTPYRVQWVDESSGKVVANYTDGTFHPPSVGNGRYSMENDFSLTISEVSVFDEATLTCEVFAHDSKSWKNSTELTVNAHGSHPSFDRCQGDKQCTKEVNNRDFQLSCTVHGAKPNVTISLTGAGKSDLTLLPASFERREDGSSDQTVYANVSMSFESSSETFTCSTHGEAAHGTESAMITVILKSVSDGVDEEVELLNLDIEFSEESDIDSYDSDDDDDGEVGEIGEEENELEVDDDQGDVGGMPRPYQHEPEPQQPAAAGQQGAQRLRQDKQIRSQPVPEDAVWTITLELNSGKDSKWPVFLVSYSKNLPTCFG